MCASWSIPEDDRHGKIVVSLLVRDEIRVAQGGAEVVIARSQLSELADKLYFLDEAFRSDARDVVEALCE
ncbi:hypothetical protein [Saccharopolyspora halophila]